VSAVASLAAEHRSPNFIVTAPTAETAQKVAEAAEAARKEQAVLWLGKEMPPWPRPMPLHITLNGSAHGSGATSFSFDKGVITFQEMQIEGTIERTLPNTLPHEIMHTVAAHYFRRPVPRWADEGMAVLSESADEQKRHDELVRKICGEEGRRIPLRKLFPIIEYPRDLLALYAEGYSVTRFLVAAKDRKTFLAFVGQGMADGWDAAAKKHYGYEDVEALEAAWLLNLKQQAPPKPVPAKGKGLPPREGGPLFEPEPVIGEARGPGNLYREAVISALLQAMRDPSGDVSMNACRSLSALGSEATPALIETLRHTDNEMRGKAAYVLGHMGLKGRGADAEMALPALAKLLKDDDVEIRKLASWAIRQIVSDGKDRED
jgi:hypothetical protein